MTTPRSTRLRREELETAICRAAAVFDVTLSSSRAYGWGDKSVGAIAMRGSTPAWLRVSSRPLDQRPGDGWFGDETAEAIRGIKKPALLASYTWRTDKLFWRGDLLEFAGTTVSATPELHEVIELPQRWWEDLRSSLDSLGRVETSRVNVRQDLVSRRIAERFGSRVDARVTRWVTVHGDIHWANLTTPPLRLLDWEGWGRGIYGLDAAFLYGFSLLTPPVARRVRRVFEDSLTQRDGLLAQLFVCAELLRMTELWGDHPDLHGPLQRLSRRVLEEYERLSPSSH